MERKIILTDDDERWRAIVRDYLESDGYLVLEAGSGRGAVTLLRDHPDLLLSL